ncbi:putative 2OG-Fe(II) oxygenase [Ferrovibrio sp.]|uniref:putative 2OG-Fe(II) oxygenase n=1 Tax=Ferrovibrio sp. TaxID=1917215 RepID=UPI003D12B6A6
MTATVQPDLVEQAKHAAFLLLQGQVDAAAALCCRIQAIDGSVRWLSGFTELLTWVLPKSQLYPLIRALVDAGFANPRSLDLLASAASWAGNPQAARQVMDLERFLAVAPLHGPDDPDLPLLAAELSGDMLDYHPEYRSIRRGWRRKHLEQVDSAVLRRMFDRLRRMALDYVERLPVDPDNPFLRSRPSNFGLLGWGVVADANTHLVSHLHSQSWINGVYYVAVPPVVADADAVDKPGWLRVGPAADYGFTAADGWDERWIQPQPGLVVLMPSHFSHETRPLNRGDERRICVAFELYSQVL